VLRTPRYPTVPAMQWLPPLMATLMATITLRALGPMGIAVALVGAYAAYELVLFTATPFPGAGLIDPSKLRYIIWSVLGHAPGACPHVIILEMFLLTEISRLRVVRPRVYELRR
jgi:hypothetical protein